MKRKGCVILCLCLSTTLLNGCSSAKLSEENQDKVAEYAAEVVLKHDANYDKKLIDMKKTTPTSEPLASQSPEKERVVTPVPEQVVDVQEEVEAAPTPIPEVSMEELYHLPNVTLSYESYDICSKYPKKTDFPMIAKKGETFVVVTFVAENKSSSKTKVNLIKRKISYELRLDDTQYDPTIAILANGGLNNFKTTLKPREKQKVVLMYNIPKEESKAKTLTLTIKDGDKKAHTIALKTNSNQ